MRAAAVLKMGSLSVCSVPYLQAELKKSAAAVLKGAAAVCKTVSLSMCSVPLLRKGLKMGSVSVLLALALSACSPASDSGNGDSGNADSERAASLQASSEQAEARSQVFSQFAVNENTPSALRFNWHYQRFLEHLVNESGRVIDSGDGYSISTSEGQAYGMWFALLAQDQGHFELMLTWADNNLAEGALGDRLPAWLWGEDEDGRWHILDDNPASDADIWMIYALYAAAERWQTPRYAAMAERLSRRLLDTTTIVLGVDNTNDLAADATLNDASVEDNSEHAQGLVLLPAPYGFTHENYIMVNPSYFNLVQIRGLASYSGDARWLEIYRTSVQIMQQLGNEMQAAQLEGMIPDWLTLDYNGRLLSVWETGREHQDDVRYGEYDAIRAYTWLAQEAYAAESPAESVAGSVAGRAAGNDAANVAENAAALLNAFRGMYDVVAEQGYPAERLSRPLRAAPQPATAPRPETAPQPDESRGNRTSSNIIDGASGRGNIGFSGVLLPYFAMLDAAAGVNASNAAGANASNAAGAQIKNAAGVNLRDAAGARNAVAADQMARIVSANPNDYRDNYYTQMLLMFGLSALQCNEFHPDGRLVVSQEVLNGCN
ncbi:glycosyl hydrolase family 8 [Aliidiomarina iranensis]|nr:glycosyl hydrolase family 8 [Aliidiomarina iranensis]